MKLEVRYNHTSTKTADTQEEAERLVRREAMATRGSRRWDGELHTIDASDGLYVYLTEEEMDADDTGADAFALICQPESRE